MEKEELITRLQEIFSIIIEDGDVSRINEFYSEDYCETINGKKGTLQDLKDTLTNRTDTEVSVIEQTYLATESTVASVHQILLKKKNGHREKANVISVFTFTPDKKLFSCNEVVVFEDRHDENIETVDEEGEKYNGIYE